MRGIRFEVNDAEDFFLSLDGIMDVSMYDWYIDDVELNYFAYRAGKYCGIDFKRSLRKLPALSFVRIRRYPIESNIGEIDTYDDYVVSNCDLLMLFYDGGFCEMYGKEEAVIDRALKLCVDNLVYIEDNDERYSMHF